MGLLVSTEQVKILQSLVIGSNKLLRVVGPTLGPSNKTVAYETLSGKPYIVDDGWQIIRRLHLQDKIENCAVSLIHDACKKTHDAQGDATTTTAIIAATLFREAVRLVMGGHCPREVSREIQAASGRALALMRGIARKVDGESDLHSIASISAGSKVLGSIAADAFLLAGKDGAVIIEENNGTETRVESVDGSRFDRAGYLSHLLVTDQGSMEAVLDDAMVVILCGEKFEGRSKRFMKAMQAAVAAGKSLFLIGEGYDTAALAAITINKVKGSIRVCAARLPEYGPQRKGIAEDLAALTCGAVFGPGYLDFEHADPSMFGLAKKVVCNRWESIVFPIGTDEQKKRVAAHVVALQKSLDTAQGMEDYDRTKLQERIMRLTGQLVVVGVGAETRTKMIHDKEKIEDAVRSIKSASAGGIVPGACKSFWTIGEDEKFSPAKRALRAPAQWLASNLGQSPASAEQAQNQMGWLGLDQNGDLVDLFKVGIIDSADANCAAITNAFSVASQMILVGAFVGYKEHRLAN